MVLHMTERKDDDTVSLTIDEVADMHRVTRRTVERWIARRHLPARKLPGGLVRIERSDAEALLVPVAGSQPGGGDVSVSPDAA